MYIPLENKTVGQSIAKLRTHKEIKAEEIAKYLKLSVSAYTKYERGETAITIPFLNIVAQFFNVSPLELLNNGPENIIENIHNSTVAMNNSNFYTVDKDVVNTFSNQLGSKGQADRESAGTSERFVGVD
jgi:transcriptional regulator with XRE-family HTH domain